MLATAIHHLQLVIDFFTKGENGDYWTHLRELQND